MLTAAMITGGIALAIGLFFLILHPFVCIFDCVISKEHKSGTKAMWVVLSLFFGFLASLIYSLLITKSPKLRKFSIQGLTLGALMLATSVGISATSPEVKQKFASFQENMQNFGATSSDAEGGSDSLDDMLAKLEEFSDEADSLAASMEKASMLSEEANESLSGAFEQLKQGHLTSVEELVEGSPEALADPAIQESATDLDTAVVTDEDELNSPESFTDVADPEWNEMLKASVESLEGLGVDVDWDGEVEINNLATDFTANEDLAEAINNALNEPFDDGLGGEIDDDSLFTRDLEEGSDTNADVDSELGSSGDSLLSALETLFTNDSSAFANGSSASHSKPATEQTIEQAIDPAAQTQNESIPTTQVSPAQTESSFQQPVSTTRTQPTSKPINRYLLEYRARRSNSPNYNRVPASNGYYWP